MSLQSGYTFEEYDKLNRQPFANFLFSLINHRDKYRRPDTSKSYTIALDAVYGSGKTRFLQMFQKMVEKTNQYSIIYYCAWEHDLYDDALSPILALLDTPAAFSEEAYKRMEQSLGMRALRILKKVGVSLLSTKAKKHFGEDYNELIGDIKDLFSEPESQPDAYDIRTKCIAEMQKALSSFTKEKPLIFVIDDLDRCNPSFAIKTLEVVKHLLDIENAIYIFALDMQQMRAAIKKFYGQEIDADGYLCKVFDYITLLPAPYPGQYVSLAFSRLNFDFKNQDQERDFISFASTLLCEHHCSLRLIDSIITTFFLLWNTFPSDHNCSQAYILYFFTLFLKFRYPQMYHTLSQTSTSNSDFADTLISFSHSNETISALANLYSCKIENSTLNLHHNDTVETICSFEVTGVNQIVYKSSSYTVSCNLSQSDSVNRLLFFDDLTRFGEIKHLTYGQYIHRQLEMYNPLSQ